MTSDPRPMPNPLPGAPEWSVKSLPRTRSHLPALVLSLFIHHAPRVQLKVRMAYCLVYYMYTMFTVHDIGYTT